jgi:hypothetical protein
VNFKKLFDTVFEKGPTSKTDVIMSLGAVILAGYKAVVTIQDYKSDNKEIEK